MDPRNMGPRRGPAMSLGECQVALAAARQETDELRDKYMRAVADSENIRKRAERDAAAQIARRMRDFSARLIEVADNLERALAHAGDDQAGADANGTASLVAGIKHVHTDVVAALERAGIERYSPEGERFDPQFHEAVAQQPVEGTEPGVVVEVFQRGYRIGDNVVRPARVVVAG